MHSAPQFRPWPLVAALLAFGVAAPALASEPTTPVSTPSPAPATPPQATTPAAKPEDVATPEAIVAALYDVISGPKGQARDWDRFRSLFAPGARMIPSGKLKDGTKGFRVITPEEYISTSEKRVLEVGFREREVHRVEERFGPLVHVFSTYEAFREGDKQPYMRGIDSIQLVNDGKRWWLLTVAWSAETPEQPLPAKYLPPSKG